MSSRISGFTRTSLLRVLSLVVFFALPLVLFRWQAALLVVLSIVVHEAGHVWALRKLGIGTSGIRFYWFGMAVIPKRQTANPADMAFAAVAGPLWGMAFAGLLLLGEWKLFQPSLLAGTASVVGVITIINLLPILGLDGAKIIPPIFRAHKGFFAIEVRLLLMLLVVSLFMSITGLGFISYIFAGLFVWHFARTPNTSGEPAMQLRETAQPLFLYLGCLLTSTFIVYLTRTMFDPTLVFRFQPTLQ